MCALVASPRLCPQFEYTALDRAQQEGKPSILDSTDSESERKKVELKNHLQAAIDRRRQEQEEGKRRRS